MTTKPAGCSGRFHGVADISWCLIGLIDNGVLKCGDLLKRISKMRLVGHLRFGVRKHDARPYEAGAQSSQSPVYAVMGGDDAVWNFRVAAAVPFCSCFKKWSGNAACFAHRPNPPRILPSILLPVRRRSGPLLSLMYSRFAPSWPPGEPDFLCFWKSRMQRVIDRRPSLQADEDVVADAHLVTAILRDRFQGQVLRLPGKFHGQPDGGDEEVEGADGSVGRNVLDAGIARACRCMDEEPAGQH